MADRIDTAERTSKLISGLIRYNITSGPSFCQVSRKMEAVGVIPWMVSGTQKWNGTNPILINKARAVMVVSVWFVISVIWPPPVVI